MNALAYMLLSMLVRKSYTGYELQKLMELFWQAKHSQIYPLLAKLVQEGLATFEVVGQTGKPDKKIYTVTDQGIAALQDWIANQPPAAPVNRDEFIIKIYAIGLAEPQTAFRLFEDRISSLTAALTYLEEEIQRMKEQYAEALTELDSRHFGRYLVFQRQLQINREEISWCRWAKELFSRHV